jgi:hypothetical protein
MRIPVLIITAITYFISAAFVSCSNDKQNKTATTAVDTLIADKPVTMDSAVESTSSAMEDTCIFNNDYKGLTMGWVEELKASGFVWNEKKFAAIKVIGHDTILLAQGGCYHFGISAEWRISDQHDLTDSVYWIRKALQFANEYQMTDYASLITDGNFYRQRDGESPDDKSRVYYRIIDTTKITNIVYDGILIEARPEGKTISLSQYVN